MKTIYLASPYSHEDQKIQNRRYRRVTKIASCLKESNPNCKFILPITMSHNLKQYNFKLGSKFDFWKKEDFEWIKLSNEVWVVMLTGWENSVGVSAEFQYARKLKKKIYFIHDLTLEKIKEKDLVHNKNSLFVRSI